MLSATNLYKSYRSNNTSSQVLKGVSLDIPRGEFLSIVGRSGSGKTTLLNVLSTLMRPDDGDILYKGEDITQLGAKQLNKLRHKDFAVIFQLHYLLPYLTALENVLLPFMNTIRPVSASRIQRAEECLIKVGLEGKNNRLPGELSGGEQQRVAIARALVKSASILFADEPTGSLDKKTGQGIMKLLSDLNSEGLTIVMVTHDREYAGIGTKQIHMEDGNIASHETVPLC